jgi:translation elongation factor EF-1alpha
MSSEFFVARCYDVGGVGLIISGTVESGEIREGTIGRTFKGKKFTLVKIEKEGEQIPKACEKDKVTIFVKHISRIDVKPGESIYFD